MSGSCLECLACCKYLKLYVTVEDMQREPRIALEVQDKRRLMPRWVRGKEQYLCPFLRGWGCEIYERRPQACRDFRRGGEECRAARAFVGKPPLDH